MSRLIFCFILLAVLVSLPPLLPAAGELKPVPYNHPGLVVDLGVGLWAWPLPMDYDGDGDLDLVVVCPDKPYNGTYFFENPGSGSQSTGEGNSGDDSRPVFKPAVRIAEGRSNVQVSYIDGEPVVMTPGKIYANFREEQYSNPITLPLPGKIDPQYKRIRANQWKLVDWDGDGDLDVIIGLGVWDDYGWDDAWDEEGNWKNGPLHGFVYLVENLEVSPGEASEGKARPVAPDPKTPLANRLAALANTTFAPARKLTTADGNLIDVYGMPSPNLADCDDDGDLDLICGEFLDGFTYFENTGSRDKPSFAPGKRLVTRVQEASSEAATAESVPLRMDLQMITPVAIDWDGDGRLDLVCGDEDGRVALLEGRTNVSASTETAELFKTPVYFQQQAADVKFGALVTPFSVDWDGDGDEDLICGNTAGYIGLIENLTGGENPRWAAPKYIETNQVFQSLTATGSDPAPSRIEAGPKGSIQGPCEAKWGYTALSVADWDQTGTLNIITNDIFGHVRVVWDGEYGVPVEVAWEGDPPKPEWVWWTPDERDLVTQWRTTPCAVDWNGDGLTDLVMLDHEGYLAFYERAEDPRDEQRNGERRDTAGPEDSRYVLLPPTRIFKMVGPCEFDSRHRSVGNKKDDLLRLNANRAGASGRRKLHVVDWDGDGRLDLLVNSVNANWLRNVRTDDEGFTWFEDMGPLDDRVLAGHTTAPATVDWDKNGIPDLLVGAEDGRLYYKTNPRAELASAAAAAPDADPAPQTQPRPVVGGGFVFDEVPFPSCHASTIAETPTGLVVAFFAGTHEKHQDVGIWVTRHVDGKWTAPVEVANGVQHADLRYPCWNPVLFQQPGGPLHLFSKCGPSPSEWWGVHQTSDDHGKSWSHPCRLPEGIDGPVKNKPVLVDGMLICGSSTEYDGWRLHFERTDDWGKTWKRIGPINDGREFNAIQPSILVHRTDDSAQKNANDGSATASKLQILCRSREGNIVTSWSSDGGLTWSALERTPLPNPNSGTDALTLADGRHLLVYNHTPRGRTPLNVAVSEDGRQWQAALVLEDEPGEYSYPAVIQTADGLVHITYTWKRKKVRHVVIDPARLQLRPIEDGQWPAGG